MNHCNQCIDVQLVTSIPHLTCLMCRVSSTVTSCRPRLSRLGNLYPASSSGLPASWPGRDTCRNSDLQQVQGHSVTWGLDIYRVIPADLFLMSSMQGSWAKFSQLV